MNKNWDDLADNLPSFYKPTSTVIHAGKLYPIHNLNQICKDTNIQAAVKQDLVSRGWALFEPEFAPAWFFAQYNKFFESGNKQAHVLDKQFPANRFGYFCTPSKQGYRYMTVEYSKHFSLPFELGVYSQVTQVDTHVRDIWNKCGQFLFEPKHNVEHIPLIAVKPKYERFGLFDIVRYEDVTTLASDVLTDNLQVHAHADPGLMSLSIGSTEDGLEMYDPVAHAWVRIPKDKWVLWCGFAAEQISDQVIKCGVHRVVAGKERLTAWYEMCVESQVPQSVLTNTEPTEEEKKVEQFLFQLEKKRGLSMSKRRPPPVKNLILDTYTQKDSSLSAALLNKP